MCVLLITRLLRGVGRWARKPVNHTSWVAVVTPTHRPKSVRNCCLIELFCGVVCVATLPLWHFCWYRGFCHRTGSDLLKKGQNKVSGRVRVSCWHSTPAARYIAAANFLWNTKFRLCSLSSDVKVWHIKEIPGYACQNSSSGLRELLLNDW